MAVAINWGLIFDSRIILALLFGVYIRAQDFWKLPYTTFKMEADMGLSVEDRGRMVSPASMLI